ncbi:MAG: YitT family protein [Firmicutes bacterium]|nr:YitT family protein [Bacillota bacterium]
MTEKREKILQNVGYVLLILAGEILYALTVKLFLLPSGLITAGTTGIALVVNHYTGMSIPTFVLIFNVAMLFLGYLVLGKRFAMTTIISTFAYPAALQMLNWLLGDVVITRDPLLCMVFSGLGLGVSLGIVIRCGASTGGMDIPPLILKHFFGIPVSLSLNVFDVCILLFQLLYHSLEDVLYGILLILIYTMVLNRFLLIGTTKTQITVVSQKSEEIRQRILQEIDRGVTLINGEGGYLRQKTQIVLSVVSNREVPRIQRLIHSIDPESFLIVARVSEVRGRGFSMGKFYR